MRTTMISAATALTCTLQAQWTVVTSGTSTQLEAVHSIDATNAIASGKDGILLRTTDGGTSWSTLVSGYADDINHIMRMAPQEFLLFADGGVVIRSVDGGDTWTPGASATTSELVGADRYNDLIIAVGEEGAIVRSSSAGASWSVVASGALSDLHAVSSIDAMAWAAVGKNGTFLSSTDGGVVWSTVTVPAVADLNDICFLTDQVGLICGDEGLLLRTTDGGATWTSTPSGTGNELYALWATSTTEVYACGAGGIVLKTTNGGLSWSPMTTPMTATLRDIVVSNGIGFAVGDLGTIIRLGQGTNGLSDSDITLGVRLSPVPANEEVLLAIADPRLQQRFTAEVIDARGVTVRRTGLIGLDARFSGLASGTYLLRLNHDGRPVHARSFLVAH